MSVLTAGLSGLDDVHAGVGALFEGTDVTVTFMSRAGSSLYLFGDIDLARGLLTDALAQLDAIAAQRTEDES